VILTRVLDPKQRANLAGTYLVAAQLTFEGFIATLTSRNTQDIDILAYYPETGKTFSIQIKTSSESSSWRQSWSVKNAKELESPNLFYVFVTLEKDKKHKFYVVSSKDVIKRMKTAKGGWVWFDAKESDLDNWGLLKR